MVVPSSRGCGEVIGIWYPKYPVAEVTSHLCFGLPACQVPLEWSWSAGSASHRTAFGDSRSFDLAP